MIQSYIFGYYNGKSCVLASLIGWRELIVFKPFFELFKWMPFISGQYSSVSINNIPQRVYNGKYSNF